MYKSYGSKKSQDTTKAVPAQRTGTQNVRNGSAAVSAQNEAPCAQDTIKSQYMWLNEQVPQNVVSGQNVPRDNQQMMPVQQNAQPAAGQTGTGQMPASQMPPGQTAAGQMPAVQMSPGQTAAGQMPAVQMSPGQTAANQMPAVQMPMGQIPMNQMPIGQMPARQYPLGQNEEPPVRFTDFDLLPVMSDVPVTAESIQYLNGFLRTQIGRRVKVEFLVGTNTFVDKEGILLGVGINYIIINETDTDDITVCDFYNIKFIRFYY